jgi:glycosyltransferase involved in cell wall biosynthesis
MFRFVFLVTLFFQLLFIGTTVLSSSSSSSLSKSTSKSKSSSAVIVHIRHDGDSNDDESSSSDRNYDYNYDYDYDYDYEVIPTSYRSKNCTTATTRALTPSSTIISPSAAAMPVYLTSRGGQQQQDDGDDDEFNVNNINDNFFNTKKFADELDDDDDAYFDDDDEDIIDYDDDDDDDDSRIMKKKKRKQKLFLKRRKQQFLNRIIKVSSLLLRREHDAKLDSDSDPVIGREQQQRTGQQRSQGGSLEYDITEEDNDRITSQSDLTRPGRYVHIVTTASLPWMTGTSVNPLLRAAYLHDRLEIINNKHNNKSNKNKNDKNDTANTNTTRSSYVTLVIPWLELPEDQQQLYNGRIFNSTKEQEEYVRDWLLSSANMEHASQNLNIVFYNARYHSDLGSVFAMGDIIQSLPQDEPLDVCVLEEPEHVNWFRAPGQGWTKRYNYVVGIVHTNYDQYMKQHYSGLWSAPAMRLISAAMVRAYCHKVIKLSDVVQEFAPEKEITSNVHGVRQEFINMPIPIPTTTTTTRPPPLITTRMVEDDDTNISANNNITTRTDATSSNDNGSSVHEGIANETATSTSEVKEENEKESAQVYYIGKLLWTKGLDLLLEYEEYYKEISGNYFAIDVYGSGPDQLDISRAFLGRDAAQRTRASTNTTTTSRKTGNTKKRTKHTNNNIQSELENVSKNMFVRSFAWLNRRRRKIRKRNNKNKNNNGDESQAKTTTPIISAEELYKEVMDVVESLPIKARESLENLRARSGDVTKANNKSMKRLPAKARRALNHLIDDLSRSPLPRSLYELRRQPIPATFPGRVDHAALKDVIQYKVFVNPSVSEVLCTTTAEALAMGKFVIIPVHPSNQFFLKFPNCLGYRSPYEFVANLQWALTHDPTPLTDKVAREFTWEAATDRFLEASSITHREARQREILGRSKIDERIAWFHNELGKGVKGDIIRKALGGGPVSGQVRYELTKNRGQRRGNATTTTNIDEDEDDIDDEMEYDVDDEDDDEGEGLPRKFRNSVFVRALREAIENGLTTPID